MTEPDTNEPQTRKHNELTLDELIWSQLQGKTKALDRYDAILWKIRSGYVIVLYGALTVLSGKDFQLKGITGETVVLAILIWVALGISLSAFLIDVSFLLAKLRVVEARDTLSDVALNLATGKVERSQVGNEVGDLLHLSGESAKWPKWSLIWNAMWSILLLYTIGPLVVMIIQHVIRG
jgi:hypothetical protein